MTKDDILRMAREANLPDPMVFYASIERFAAMVAAAEREACAKVCDAIQKKHEDEGAWLWEAKNCASAIRARSQNE